MPTATSAVPPPPSRSPSPVSAAMRRCGTSRHQDPGPRDVAPVSRCLIRANRMVANASNPAGSAEESRLVRAAEPRFPACFDGFAQSSRADWLPKYGTANMRAALVRALLQARRHQLPADLPPAAAAVPWYPVLPGSQQAPADISSIVAADLGSCLARKHWRNVLAIINAVDPKAESLDFAVAWRVESARKREAAAVDSELGKVVPSIAVASRRARS